MEILKNCSLKNLNTFNLNISAKELIKFNDESEIKDYFKRNDFDTRKSLILGSGSNILFTADFDGVILKSEIQGIKIVKKINEFVYIEVGSGVIWDDLVKYCVDNSLYGIENLSLIPGTVGAAPIQNIGAYGVEFEEVFEELEGIDLLTLEKKVFTKNECEFGYRDSIFKHKYKNTFFITKVKIKLKLKSEIKTSYRAIQDHIKENKLSVLNLKVIRDIIISIRSSKLPDPQKIGNAGSFFKNPTIGKQQFIELREKHKDLVHFDIGNSMFKIPAGWLIEKIGYKGKRIGNVGVHSKQALVLVNYGNGNGTELLKLSNEIKSKIFEKFNIILETEVNIV